MIPITLQNEAAVFFKESPKGQDNEDRCELFCGVLRLWVEDSAAHDVLGVVFPLIQDVAAGVHGEEDAGHGCAEDHCWGEGRAGEDGGVRERDVGGVQGERG